MCAGFFLIPKSNEYNLRRLRIDSYTEHKEDKVPIQFVRIFTRDIGDL